MIVFRYISKQILLTTFAITVVLVLVVMSSRFAQYTELAAAGKVSVEVIFPVLIYSLPQMLELVLPLSYFLAILIAFGQLYESNEMTVLHACGFSKHQILSITLANALFMGSVVAMFSFYVTPLAKTQLNRVITEQGMQSELGGAAPGRFYELSRQRGTVYASEFNDERTVMNDVFIRRHEPLANNGFDREYVVSAAKGYQELNPNGNYYFVLENGISYRGTPGFGDFEITRFDFFGQKMDDPQPIEETSDQQELRPILTLYKAGSPEEIAELNWRVSLPILVLIVTGLALPLSKTDPRSGRFAKVIPAILLYLIYIVALNAGKGMVQKGELSSLFGFWLVHLLFLGFAVLLYFSDELRRRRIAA